MVISNHGEMTTMNGFCFQYGHAIEVALIQVEIVFCMLEFHGISPKNYITHMFGKLSDKKHVDEIECIVPVPYNFYFWGLRIHAMLILGT
jgi:hypothetical protein